MLNSILNIDGISLLPKEQQKSINGGRDAGTCAVIIYGSPPDTWGTPNGFTPTIHTNISRDTAWSALAAAPFGGRWCCDTCNQASWLQ